MPDTEWFTPEEAAEALKMHVVTIRRLLREGRLPGAKVGKRQWRIHREALDRFISGGGPQERRAESVTE